MNVFYNPVRTYAGEGALSHLKDILQEMNPAMKRVLLLVWNEQVMEKEVFQLTDTYAVCEEVFTASNPTVAQLFRVYQRTKQFSPEVVIAVGGGSTMDVGKSLCCMYGNDFADEEEVRNWIKAKDNKKPSVQWIGVATTAGTGSEVTCWATIWDPDNNAKLSMENHANYAYAAIADPEMTKGMPMKLAVSSALDACAHAVESYWANHTNAVSRGLALQAIRIIMRDIDGMLSGNEEARQMMSVGSMMAGLAFSNTKTTACHSISYPLTMHYGIPHGAAVSMLLGEVTKLNSEKTKDLHDLYDALGVTDADALSAKVKELLERSGHPSTLSAWGVKKEDLARLASEGMTKGRADNNPVALNNEMIQTILENIY